ncbi:MAG: hypothetical protein MUC65_08480 [Pontiellaceae bacterium]|jgi:hypothetical protein|nr:hypothetical protein [Pontiellaceae bacterium]
MNKTTRLLIYLFLVMPFAVHAETAEKSLVVGKDEKGVQVRILAVDGNVVKDKPVRLTPGAHKLAVSCIKTESYGALSVDTILVLTVKPDCDYELRAFFEGKNAKVAVTAKVVRKNN